jgi:hypothetical protein
MYDHDQQQKTPVAPTKRGEHHGYKKESSDSAL